MNIDTSELVIPRSEYPVTITILDMMTRAERWSFTVPEPGIVNIPTVMECNGGKLAIIAIKGKSGHGAQFPPEDAVRLYRLLRKDRQ